MRRNLLNTLCLAIIVNTTFAQTNIYDSGGPILPEQAAYDVNFYDLELFVNPADSSIDGKLTADAKVLATLDWFVLDLDTLLTVKEVTIPAGNGINPLTFERRVGKIWIKLPSRKYPGDEVSVTVAYGGRPLIAQVEKGSWSDGFIWTHSRTGEPWLGVVSVLDGADIWWPCKDHPSDEPDSMALHITVPEPLTVAANGQLRDYVRHGGRDRLHTFYWFISTPINNYGVTLNIAQYSKLEGAYRSINGDRVPLTFWCMPEDYVKAMRLFPQMKKQLRFFEKTLGPYPFRADKYSVAQTPYLGMEHQTIISYGGDFKNNKYGFDTLHFHELSHEWFANMVTVPDWRDWWLHEGVASYLEAIYAESLDGLGAYHDYMADFRDRIQNEAPLAPRFSQRSRDIYGPDLYSKGAWILHSLRYLIGRQALLQALRRMTYPEPIKEYVTDGSQCHFVTTDQFQAIVEDVSGQDLDWFFEVYLRQPDLPRLHYWVQDNMLTLRWDAPEGLPFPMPVEVAFGSSLQKVDMLKGQATITLPAGAKPVVDPYDWILKSESFQTTSKLD